MRKPWENERKLSDGRKTVSPHNGKFVACVGSFEKPSAITTEEYGVRVKGMCGTCGKWCVLRDATMPRHKELSHVVQDWQVH